MPLRDYLEKKLSGVFAFLSDDTTPRTLDLQKQKLDDVANAIVQLLDNNGYELSVEESGRNEEYKGMAKFLALYAAHKLIQAVGNKPLDVSSLRSIDHYNLSADHVLNALKHETHSDHAEYARFAIGCTGLIEDMKLTPTQLGEAERQILRRDTRLMSIDYSIL